MREIKILWADDDDVQYEACSRTLDAFLRMREIQAIIIRAVDGNDVYQPLFHGVSFDLILVDIEMPRWNGIKAVRDIAKKYPGLPIIIISAKTTEEEFEPVLPQLVEKNIIRGFYEVGAQDDWCQAVLQVVSVIEPSILHISDIHFGEYHAFKKGLRIEDVLSPAIESINAEMKPNIVAISGDVTSKGEEGEFSRVEEFLLWLVDKLKIGLSQVIIVPGNHDIFRPEQPTSRLKKYVEFLNSLYGRSSEAALALKNYPKLYDARRNELRLKGLTSDDLCSITILDEFRTLVIGLNSVIAVEQDRWDFGEISPLQLATISDRLSRLQPPRSEYFRIAVFHHHLFVVPSIFSDGEPERLIRNQGLVLHSLISNRVKLALHGHTHYSIGYNIQPYFLDPESNESSPLHVFATGTLSGREHELAQSYFHMTVIRCSMGERRSIVGACVTPYRLVPNTLEWKVGRSVDITFA